jgi:hypothetical protein
MENDQLAIIDAEIARREISHGQLDRVPGLLPEHPAGPAQRLEHAEKDRFRRGPLSATDQEHHQD